MAPPITAQSDPFGSPPEAAQRTHWRENEVGDPVQIPCVAVRVAPTVGVPVIVGWVVFSGSANWAAAPAPASTATATRKAADRPDAPRMRVRLRVRFT